MEKEGKREKKMFLESERNTQLVGEIEQQEVAPLRAALPDGRIKQARLSQKVFDFVVNGIITGRLEPNQNISQRFLGEQLSLSHFPIREAMEKLEQDGWVKRLAKKAARRIVFRLEI